MAQFQTQQLMTSEIRSLLEYLIQTYNIFVLIIFSKNGEKGSLNMI